MAKSEISALERHRRELVERAVRLREEKIGRAEARKERELAELRATGMIVPSYNPVAEAVEMLKEKRPDRGWLKFW